MSFVVELAYLLPVVASPEATVDVGPQPRCVVRDCRARDPQRLGDLRPRVFLLEQPADVLPGHAWRRDRASRPNAAIVPTDTIDGGFPYRPSVVADGRIRQPQPVGDLVEVQTSFEQGSDFVTRLGHEHMFAIRLGRNSRAAARSTLRLRTVLSPMAIL